jgi:hypothetical protein
MKKKSNIFNLETYIRVIFSSLMLLPLIILGYFVAHLSDTSDCLTGYYKNKPVSGAKPIPWPDNGLLTIWFDSHFFIKNKRTIMELMDKYQFPGVISVSNEKSCHAQSLSMYQLIRLHNQGWEITKTNKPINGEHAINDMPAPDRKKQVIYDMSHSKKNVSLNEFLKETSLRNGWIILYFHTNMDSKIEEPMNISKLNHILQNVSSSQIPVVLQEQVLKVSQ